jgi:RNA polymerase sigma-70 factor (ECF subfamily)
LDPAPRRISAESLFRTHAAFVATFVRRLGCFEDQIDDAVQEVFLTAHRRGGFEEGPAKPTTWLAEIALRVVSTLKRTASRKRTVADPDAVERCASSAATPFDTAASRSALARVDRALGALDVDRRAVFILFEIEGESCETIAKGLGVPVGTVHSRLFSARKKFFEAYAKLETHDPVRETQPRMRVAGGEVR